MGDTYITGEVVLQRVTTAVATTVDTTLTSTEAITVLLSCYERSKMSQELEEYNSPPVLPSYSECLLRTVGGRCVGIPMQRPLSLCSRHLL
jgi:hypothetical protein